MMDVGPGELMVILVAALLLFGKRLPEMARNIGRTVAEVKRGLQASALPLRQVEADIGREIPLRPYGHLGNQFQGKIFRPTDAALHDRCARALALVANEEHSFCTVLAADMIGNEHVARHAERYFLGIMDAVFASRGARHHADNRMMINGRLLQRVHGNGGNER